MNIIENILAAIGLLAVLGAAAIIILSLEAQTCTISIQTAKGTSCYVIKERQ